MCKTRGKCTIPPRLVSGDTIGVAAPASPFDMKLFEAGLAVLKQMGFQVNVPEAVFEKNGYLAGSDPVRAEVLNRLFADPEIQGIICARGGFGSMKILPFLDFDTIRKNPKAFIGFSDISAVLSVLEAKCNLVAFHGPVVTTLGRSSEKMKDSFLSALTSDQPVEISAIKGICIQPGVAMGPVSGGNLATLCHLVGTPFEPTFSGKILLLEDCGEACYRIDRMLTQMKLAGCFEKIAGIALGSFQDCGDEKSLYGIIKQIFKEDEIPIMTGFEVGHGDGNMTLPLGLDAVLDTTKGSLCFKQPATVGPPVA
jgi:muramoyltetrapeptide carboxypeptidase